MFKLQIFLFLFFTFIAFGLKSQTAEFTASASHGCDNLYVSFTSLSTGTITSYQWNFGDGSTVSNEQNPSHFYNTTGIYTVTLTVFNGTASNSITKTDYINITKSPSANFSSDVTTGCVPLEVNFTNLTVLGDTTIYSWYWDFGDGSSSSEMTPTHTYSSSGNYNVSLFVTDDFGCTSESNKVNYIQTSTNTLTANFTINKPTGCSVPHTITITNTSTGNISSYYWDFGNGITDTSANPEQQTYNDFNTYTINLIVSGGNGCEASISKIVTITPFTADFSIDTTTGCQPFTAHFTSITTGATFWKWNFGDGGSATQQNPSHLFNSSGIYDIQLISGNSNCSDTIVKSIEITVIPKPNVNFSSDDSSACMVPFDFEFFSQCPDAVTWLWNFGNGQTSTTEQPIITYNDTGSFNVALTITDANNCTNTITKPQYINIVLPKTKFGFEIKSGCKPLEVAFIDSSFSVEQITHWYWDFGDGTPVIDQQNPTHTYIDTGSYSVKLIIENIKGCTDSVIYLDTVLVGDHKTVNFSPLDTAGCYKLPVPFTDLSDDVTDEWYWDFGDGGNSILANPSHTYADTGYFDVFLVAGFHGCYDTLFVDSVVQVWPPIAKFITDGSIGCDTPFVVTFSNISVLADTAWWDFGDFQSFNGQNPPPHTYDTIRFYDVWLYVENFSTGCKDSISQQIKISDIRVGYFPDTISGCQPFTAHFNDTTYVNTTISSWLWDFGDNDTTAHTQQNPTHTYQQNGIYDVNLIITDQLGCSDSLRKLTLIDVKELPNVGFATDTTYGCVPLSVVFTDTSHTVVPIISWDWNYGDASTGTGSSSSHTYNTRGVYSVKLTVVDSNNCSGFVNMSNLITATKPYTNFTVPNITCNDKTINFTSSSGIGTTTSDVLSYNWDFGDGTTSALVSPTHAYHTSSETSVSFNATLLVTDQNGCDSSITKPVTLSIPTAYFGATETNATCPPFYVEFKDSSISSPGTISQWEWEFGDNTAILTLQNPTHSYFNSGTFGVTLIATDSYGCKDTIVRDPFINISGPTGTIQYSINDTTTCIPSITFIAQSENSVLNLWVFDDGKLGQGDTIIHSYYVPGSYNPVLIIQDNAGCQDEIELDAPITVNFPVVTLNLTSTNTICTSHIGTATATASGGTTPYFYNWEDGQSTTTAVNLGAGSFSLTVLDALECPGVASITIGTDNIPFLNSFTNTNEICTGSNGTSTSNPSAGNEPYTFVWDNGTTSNSNINLSEGNYFITITDALGCFITDATTIQRTWITFESNITKADVICANVDGSISTNPTGGQSPYSYHWNTGHYTSSIIHLAPDTFYVTITDAFGCSVTDSAIIIASDNNSIDAIFSVDTNNVLSAVPITFTSNSIDSLPIINYSWNIDNQTISDTIGFLTYKFEESGNYTVMLYITDTFGCVDSASTVITILDGLEVPNVFSPNGDGINDVFYIQDSGIETYSIQIFNRWGVLMFEETAPKIYWTGKTTAGVDVPAGTYYYIIKATSVLGKNFEFSSYLTLIR